jgi:hypothetical protein
LHQPRAYHDTLLLLLPCLAVVTTFHISTMTINQRSALAKSWLADSKTPEEPDQEAAAGADAGSNAGSDNSSASDSSESGSPPDLLETWIIMEFCERGSLERALKLGKFKARDGSPEMVRTLQILDLCVLGTLFCCDIWCFASNNCTLPPMCLIEAVYALSEACH